MHCIHIVVILRNEKVKRDQTSLQGLACLISYFNFCHKQEVTFKHRLKRFAKKEVRTG